MASSARSLPRTGSTRTLSVRWRIVISLILLVHLTAVIAAPWSGPEPSSPLSMEIVRPFGPYLDALYLGHGYRFFAPEPGPSHLVRYTLEMPDGSSRGGTFPDKQAQWPRLFYHRHFMLSEKLNGLKLDLPPQAPAEFRDRWQKIFDGVARSYAMHLLKTTGAQRVTLELVRHQLPTPAEWEGTLRLSDPKKYEVIWSGSFREDTPERMTNVESRMTNQ